MSAVFVIGIQTTMKPSYRMLASLVAVSAAVCVSSISFAQSPPPGATPPPAAQDRWAERMRDAAEARARALHDILNIRPDQEAAFQAYQVAMTPPEGSDGMRKHHDEEAMAKLTTPERLDRITAQMVERQSEFQSRAAAIKQFYSVLSADQQRAFDALLGLMDKGGHDMGHEPMEDRHDHGGDHD